MILFSNCSVGIIFIIIGVIFKLWPPEHINDMMGYRTPFSKKNKEVWDEGNRFSSIMMIVSGIMTTIISILITFLYKNSPGAAVSISTICSLIITLGFVFYTEIHLRKIFDKDGNRKV